MLWAEGIGVAVSECRCGCMALVVRASEPLGLGLDEGVPAWDQRTRTEAVQDHFGVIGRVSSQLFCNFFPTTPANTREEDAMVAPQNRRAHKPACNENGSVSILCRKTKEPRASILRVASALAGAVSVSYVVDGVLLIAPARNPPSAA